MADESLSTATRPIMRPNEGVQRYATTPNMTLPLAAMTADSNFTM